MLISFSSYFLQHNQLHSSLWIDEPLGCERQMLLSGEDAHGQPYGSAADQRLPRHSLMLNARENPFEMPPNRPGLEFVFLAHQ